MDSAHRRAPRLRLMFERHQTRIITFGGQPDLPIEYKGMVGTQVLEWTDLDSEIKTASRMTFLLLQICWLTLTCAIIGDPLTASLMKAYRSHMSPNRHSSVTHTLRTIQQSPEPVEICRKPIFRWLGTPFFLSWMSCWPEITYNPTESDRNLAVQWESIWGDLFQGVVTRGGVWTRHWRFPDFLAFGLRCYFFSPVWNRLRWIWYCSLCIACPELPKSEHSMSWWTWNSDFVGVVY